VQHCEVEVPVPQQGGLENELGVLDVGALPAHRRMGDAVAEVHHGPRPVRVAPGLRLLGDQRGQSSQRRGHRFAGTEVGQQQPQAVCGRQLVEPSRGQALVDHQVLVSHQLQPGGGEDQRVGGRGVAQSQVPRPQPRDDGTLVALDQVHVPLARPLQVRALHHGLAVDEEELGQS